MRRQCGCGRIYGSRSGLFRHIRAKHEGLPPKGTTRLKRGRPETKPQNRKRRVCSCGKTFKYRQGLHRHVKDKHGGRQPNAFELKEDFLLKFSEKVKKVTATISRDLKELSALHLSCMK